MYDPQHLEPTIRPLHHRESPRRFAATNCLVFVPHYGQALAAGGAIAAETGWMVPTAKRLFERATVDGWDAAHGGLVYLVQLEPDGRTSWRDDNKYYWALAEMIGAAGLLAVRTGEERYWRWYDAAWACAHSGFIDAERGGWYPMLNARNERVDPYASADHVGLPIKCYPSKTDYHPLAACWEVLRALESS